MGVYGVLFASTFAEVVHFLSNVLGIPENVIQRASVTPAQDNPSAVRCLYVNFYNSLSWCLCAHFIIGVCVV